MDTALKTDRIEHYAPVWRGTAVQELTEEYVVPDSMPDVGAVADAESVITLQGKDTDSGAVRLSATASVTVVYIPEEGVGLRTLELTLPADIRMDAPGADLDSRTVARLRMRTLEARVVNSRKIALRAELEAEAACYRSEFLEVATAMEDADAVHLRRETAEVTLVSDVQEKTFAVTDEYAFPSGCEGTERILSRRVEIVGEEAQYVGGKVLFRGRVRSELLFGSEDGARTAVGRYETEFSQIMEAQAGEGGVLPELSLFFTGVYFDLPEYGQSTGRIQAELHLAAQCVCREGRSLPYIADLYSNRTVLVPRRESLELVESVRPVLLRQTVAERMENTVPDGELLRVSAAVGGVAEEDGAVRTNVNLRLICALPGGKCVGVRSRAAAEFTLPDLAGAETLRDISVSVTDVYCVPGTGDVRVSLRLDALAEKGTAVECVCAAEEDEAAWSAQERTPSAVLLRVPAGADLWTLARRYHSTVEDIRAVNEGRSEGLLLIPKGR